MSAHNVASALGSLHFAPFERGLVDEGSLCARSLSEAN
jgi:hypothetical protein